MNRLKEKFKKWNWETRLLAVFALAALVPTFASLWTPQTPIKGSAESVDTHIPRGFVLIPIEVHNYEALDSLFGRYGLVDLYLPPENGASQRLVALNVRLIRAPHNPSRFAVLVPESESPKILSHGGSYVVSIKPPGSGGTEFVKSKGPSKRKIVYGGL